jgi:hypothetical protein
VHSQAGQFPKLPNRFRRNKAAAQQAILLILCDPSGIDAIRLLALQRPNRGWVYQRQFQ